MSKEILEVGSQWMGFEEVNRSSVAAISIAAEAEEKIRKCRSYLDEKLARTDEVFYGINTGFGFLQNVKIDKEQIEQLQYNLLRSHACGMGEEVPADSKVNAAAEDKVVELRPQRRAATDSPKVD